MILDNTSITLIIIAVLVVLYLMYGNGDAINNMGYVTRSSDVSMDSDENGDDDSMDNSTTGTIDTASNDSSDDSDGSSSTSYESMQRKMTGRNSIINNGGDPAKLSYSEGSRGGSFDESLEKMLSGSQAEFTGVQPVQNSGSDGYAGFQSSGSGSGGADDMFNAGSLLPAQQTDWFEVHNNVNVKNSHLINVYRPVGANTVSGSLRNASHDFRGDIANPKYVVSPWLQSTISPDHNNKGLC